MVDILDKVMSVSLHQCGDRSAAADLAIQQFSKQKSSGILCFSKI